MTQKWLELVVAFLVTFVILGIEHYLFTWRIFTGRRMKPPWTYILGVLSLGLPFSALMYRWSLTDAIIALAVVAVAGGLAVGGGYHLLGDRRLREENWELRAALGKMGGRGNEERGREIPDHRSTFLRRKDQGA